MPLYDFMCTKCAKVEERSKSIADDSQELCTNCKEPMQKLIRSPIIFTATGRNNYSSIKKKNDIIDKHLEQMQKNFDNAGIKEDMNKQLNISKGKYTNYSQAG